MFPESESNDEVAEQLKKMTFEPNFKMLFDYGRPDGTPLQKEAARKYITRMGYDAKSESILFAGGGQNSIAACLAGLFKPGDSIGTNPFIYPGLKTVAAMFGIQLIPIKQKGEEITREALLYACRNENIKGLYLIPDYNNPTSHTISKETRRMIGEIAVEENLIIIEDGSFSFMRAKPMLPLAYYAPENTIYISNLSKVIAPGLRLAFVTVPKRFKRAMSIALYNMNISLSPLMIELVSRLINSGVAEEITKKKRKNTNERNKLINKVLRGYDIKGDKNCIFRWLILPEGLSGEEFEKKAYKRGVQVYSSERFAVGSTKPFGAVRLAVGSPKNEEELMEGLNIIKNLLEEEKVES
jgi:DNA-binding transcriptional MocR family regulator